MSAQNQTKTSIDTTKLVIEKRHAGLRITSSAFKVLAIVQFLGGCITASVFIKTSMLSVAAAFIVGVGTALVWLAIGQLIELLVSLEHETRRAARINERLLMTAHRGESLVE